MSCNEIIRNIDELSIEDVESYGPKAVNLSLLMKKGLSVPNGFCVSARADTKFFENVEKYRQSTNGISISPKDLRIIAAEQKVSSSLISDIKKRLVSFTDEGVKSFAVRSSAIEEDSEKHSFAGLYKSYLNLKKLNEIVGAIKLVWLSQWDDAPVEYRKRMLLEPLSNRNTMAVIVQEMMEAKFSGVCFTRNPLVVNENLCVIEFTKGTAEKLVDGINLGSRVVIDRPSLKIKNTTSKNIVSKELDFQKLVKIAIKIENHFGSPQDIEWCIDDQKKIWILQARSITKRSAMASQKKKIEKLKLMYKEPFSTFGCELAVKRHVAWMHAINKFYLISEKPKLRVDGSLIYFQKPLSNRNVIFRTWLRLVQTFNCINSQHILKVYNKSIMPKYNSVLKKIHRESIDSLSLINLYENLEKAIDIYIDSQIKNYAIGRISQTALNIFSRYVQFISFENDYCDPLVYLTYNNPTIKRDKHLEKILKRIKGQLTLGSTVGLSFSKLRKMSKKKGKLKQSFKQLEVFIGNNSYLWADRYPRDPGWKLDQDRINSTIEQKLKFSEKGNLSKSVIKSRERTKRALSEMEINLSKLALGKFWISGFNFLLSRVNSLAGYKEQRNLFLYSVIMVIRMITIEVGRRLVEKGELLNEDDIFYLKQEEILQVCSPQLSAFQCKELIKKRKSSFLKVRSIGISQSGNELFNTVNPTNKLKTYLGTRCSSGIAHGKVRLILSGESLSSLTQDEIAVCYNFRPAWSIILGITAGLVIEEANILSHGAILAREYGVPTVVNIPGIVSKLNNGNFIEVNGSNGFVKLISI